VATPQHCWPSLDFDIGALNSLMAPFFPSGFYYKTFMWPASLWMTYEHVIRKAAGMGSASRERDPDRYDKRHAHCDLLIVGGGPAGLAAALAAGRSGARVMLVEQGFEFGGALLGDKAEIDGKPADDWAAGAVAELASLPEVTLLSRTTAFGYYDGNTVALAEKVSDHLLQPEEFQVRQRLWVVRAKRVILATGAIERPIVFGDNDRPGVMLAGAARQYANRFAALPGKQAVVFTTHDEAYKTAFDLADAGVKVAAVVDPRPDVDGSLADAVAARGIEHLPGHAVVRALGGKRVRSALVAAIDANGAVTDHGGRPIACDALCISGGWAPSVHLHSQTGPKPVYDERLRAFVPGEARQQERSIGAAAGKLMLSDCLSGGFAAGAETAGELGFSASAPETPSCSEDREALPHELWSVPKIKGGKRFIDIQDDVTTEDLALAEREGYRSVEHLKRYTTLGMGTDQGKTSNINGLAILSERRNLSIPEVGTTTFRPPFVPITLGSFAGRETGKHFRPTRRSPLHDWHAANGAVFVEVGPWLRPRYYPQAGEGLFEAQNREAKHTRSHVGLCDVSSLGKIDIQGPDAAEFLNRVYVNGFKMLPVGKARYGLMLREDGHVYDDGTTSRFAENHFMMTTTTANAGPVLAQLEFHLQVTWPELKVHLTSLTDQWGGMAIAGPKSREVLAKAAGDVDVGNEALPFMGVTAGQIAGCPVKIFRISFSGELAYEVATPSDHAITVWEALMEAGRAQDIIPYGSEALAVMRIEKGHVAGPELDGRTTAADLGLGRMCSTKKDYIGRRMMQRPGLTDPDRPALVGLVPVDGKTKIPAGAILLEEANPTPPVANKLGHVSSVTWSENLGHPIALALLRGGMAKEGETVYAAFPLRDTVVPSRVVSPHFFDPEGKRLHA
jgi:sarcosine oxidase subunit alpha